MPTPQRLPRLSMTGLLLVFLGFSSCFEDCDPSRTPTGPSQQQSTARADFATPNDSGLPVLPGDTSTSARL
jgi:hypothetical protein